MNQRGEALAVGLAVGLTEALGAGVMDAPGFGDEGVVFGVGEMPGELFRIGCGLVPGIGWALGLVADGTLPPGLVVPG